MILSKQHSILRTEVQLIKKAALKQFKADNSHTENDKISFPLAKSSCHVIMILSF